MAAPGFVPAAVETAADVGYGYGMHPPPLQQYPAAADPAMQSAYAGQQGRYAAPPPAVAGYGMMAPGGYGQQPAAGGGQDYGMQMAGGDGGYGMDMNGGGGSYPQQQYQPQQEYQPQQQYQPPQQQYNQPAQAQQSGQQLGQQVAASLDRFHSWASNWLAPEKN